VVCLDNGEAMLPAVGCLGRGMFGGAAPGVLIPATLAVAVLLRKPHRSAQRDLTSRLKRSVALMNKHDSYTIPAATHPVNNT